jgi:hypothetical protein
MSRFNGDKKREVKRLTSWFMDEFEWDIENENIPSIGAIVGWCNINVGRGDMKLYRTVVNAIKSRLEEVCK